MFYLLNWRLWVVAGLVAALAVTHQLAYRTGKNAVRQQWDKDIAQRTAKALEIEQQTRQKEQQLIAAKQQVEIKYAELKKQAANSAAAAVGELDKLRDELASIGGKASPDAASCPRTASRAGLESDLLGNCAKALTDLAAEADRLEAVVVGLQLYVKNICLKQ